jgi:DNA-binding GntR family transcriptional regulator
MPTTDAPQPRRLLRDEVYDTILGAILDGTLEPGEVLHDEELMTWLGSSRTPIREALNRLAEEDVVELVPHRHTRVAPIDIATVNEDPRAHRADEHRESDG